MSTKYLLLLPLILTLIVSGCDCGGEPEWKIDDDINAGDLVNDISLDVISDTSIDIKTTDTIIDTSETTDAQTDITDDTYTDVQEITDITTEDLFDVKPEDTSDAQDVSTTDSQEDTTMDIQEDVNTDVILEDTISDTIEDTGNNDAITTDGGYSATIIKECPKSPNNLTKVIFEFTNPDATSFECRLNDSDWIICSSPYEIPNSQIPDLSDGENRFLVRALFNEVQELMPAECVWIKDTIAPDTIFSSAPDFECKSDISLEVESTEDDSIFEYSIDNSEWIETTGPVEISNLPDGTHKIAIRAKDAAGNIDDTPLEYEFNTDTTAPDLIVSNKPDEYINYNNASFTFSSLNEPATFMCSLNGGNFYECQSPQVFNNLIEQKYKFMLFAKDACDNASSVFEYSFTVDLTEPQSSITSKPSLISNDKNPSFDFICSEESTTECKIDNESFTTCTPPVSYNLLSDGEHRFEVRCIDKAKNVESTPSFYIWRIDTVSPETTLISRPDSPSKLKNATFEFSCSEQGSAECSLDSALYSACTSPISYTNLSDGNHNFSVRCIDEAGNVDNTPAIYNWTIDTTPPVTTITEYPENYTKSTSATFRFICNENGMMECRLDSQSWTNCSSPKVYINLTNGSHIFSVRCTDSAGNIETSPPVYSWVVDTIPPETYIVNHPPTISNSTTAEFVFGCNESECTYECSLNSGAYINCLSNHQFTNLLEGFNKVCVRATDKAGNTDSSPDCYQWNIDITEPDTFILSNPPPKTNQTTATFTFDSNETGSVFECSLDGSAYSTCQSPKTYTGLNHGTHTFKVRSIDIAGNTDQTPAIYNWEVDIEAPKSTILTYPANPSNSTTATFTFTSDDPNATYECSIDGLPFTSCTSPKSYIALDEGTHNFRVRARDNIGNVEQNPPSYTWDIDITPPDTALLSFPSDPTNNPSPLFSFQSSEAGSTFECSYDFGEYFICASPHNWNNISEGLRYFSVRAKDLAGNIDPTPAQYSFNVDLTEPETYIINKPSNPTKNTTAKFTFYSNESDTTFECKLDNSGYLPCTSPMEYNSLTDGVHTFYVRAIDLAGNIDSTPASYEWKIDTVAPDTNILTNPPSITNSKNAQFTFNCLDDSLPCSFECSLDGTQFSLCTSPVQYTNLSDGNHTFSVRAIDAAQNVDTTPAQYNWKVDTIPPQAFIDNMPANPSLTTDATFAFHCNESSTTECSLDGAPYTICTSPKTYSSLSVGSHNFSLRCIDLANNVSMPVNYSWDIMRFNIERVDAPRYFANFYNRAIKTDSNNIPHIVYGGDNLYHAYLSGTNFVTEIIDNTFGLGEYASLHIDKNNSLHISYYNPTNLSLMYATNAGGVWSKTTVDSGNNVGLYSSIVVDRNGFVHIAYFDNTTYDLKYATNTTGVWTTQVVEAQYISGEFCSIAVDSSNTPHITYYKRGFSPNKGVLRYARKNGAVWDIQTLDDQGDGMYVGMFTSLFIDESDDIYVSYFDASNLDLRFIKYSSGVWESPIIVESAGDVGRYNSLVVDSDKTVHITYYNTNGTLRYANNKSGVFVPQLVDNSASVGLYNSLSIDNNGVLHASYYDSTNAKLKYAMRLTTGNWTNFKFVDSAGSVGQYPSIYLDNLKRPHVCYYDTFFGGELKYAYKENGVWNISTIDNGGVSNYNVGRYCNLKTDASNKVHISYLDVSRGNIKYITNTTGNWISENPDNINTVGQYQTSLAIDANGKVHISYYDSSNGGELRYSNNVNGYWLSVVVDDGGITNANVGQYNSIAIDRNGFVHISYYDATNADLKYATNRSGSFVNHTIDSSGSVGAYTSIAIDSNNNPVISYYDGAPNYNLKVAIFDGTNWSTSVVDSHINNVGLYTSISIDASDRIHIAYYDATIYKIKYATNKYGSWQNFIIDTEGRLGTYGYTTGIFATPGGMVHIIYYDYLMRDLKYATNEN